MEVRLSRSRFSTFMLKVYSPRKRTHGWKPAVEQTPSIKDLLGWLDQDLDQHFLDASLYVPGFTIYCPDENNRRKAN